MDRAAHSSGSGPSQGMAASQKPALSAKPRAKLKRKEEQEEDGTKRRCVSTACIACRKRKSKCDGNQPSCAACSSVYYTECVYDPNSDHRRKGVYRKDDKIKPQNSTLEILIQAILNVPDSEIEALVKQIRTCESLDSVAESLLENQSSPNEEDMLSTNDYVVTSPTFESHLSTKMGDMMLEEGTARYIGGTSNLLLIGENKHDQTDESPVNTPSDVYGYDEDESPITSWTTVTHDTSVVDHLMTMYFTWHYPYFTCLSKNLFLRDFKEGRKVVSARKLQYCTPLLVNAMLALGCHFTSIPGARAVKDDSSTAGDAFFKEAKRLIMQNDEHEKPKLATVQAFALMSVREAGCGRESRGWVYSGMSFRMACDLGLNLDSGSISTLKDVGLDEEEIDARRITFWGCFQFDKCWSNYLGRLPQLPMSIVTVPRFDVFPNEDSETWVAYTDSGDNQAHAQPSRIRAISLQTSTLCEISGDLMNYFYNPINMDKSKGKKSELNKLSDIHQRLETWRRNLPVELEPKEGGLPSMLLMHMFYQLLYIHLFRPFLRYRQETSPLPLNVSPRRLCTQAAQAISKLLRLYKRSHGLRQICNIAVYMAHSACTIHLLNLPDKNAKRDITHGVKHLEEIAESWLCARRTLAILSVLSRQWRVDLPEEAATVLERTDVKFAKWNADIQAILPRSSSYPPSDEFDRRNAPYASTNNYGPSSSNHNNTNEYGGFSVNFLPSESRVSGPMSTSNAVSKSVASPQVPTSMDNQSSPEAHKFQISSPDGDDWWIADQRELANGFGHWPPMPTSPIPFNASPTWKKSEGLANGSTRSDQSSTTESKSIKRVNGEASLLNGAQEDNLTLMNMFNGWNNNTHYNENDWYQ